MKSLQQLSKNELISFIINYGEGEINIFDKIAECSNCGKKENAKYYYICDNCNKILVKG